MEAATGSQAAVVGAHQPGLAAAHGANEPRPVARSALRKRGA